MNKFFCFMLVALMFLCPVLAHSGKTDSKGGHYDHQNDGYHYHHGYPAHQHTGGVCPYDYDNKTGQNSGGSSSYTYNTTYNTNSSYSSKTTNKSSGGDNKMSTGAIVWAVVIVLFILWAGFRVRRTKSENMRSVIEDLNHTIQTERSKVVDLEQKLTIAQNRLARTSSDAAARALADEKVVELTGRCEALQKYSDELSARLETTEKRAERLAMSESEAEYSKKRLEGSLQTIQQKDDEIQHLREEISDLRNKLKNARENERKHRQEMAQMQRIQFVQKYGIDSADSDPVPHKYCPVCCLRNADDAEVCRECEHDFRSDSVSVRALPPASSFVYWLDNRYDTSYQRLRKKNAKRIRVDRYDPVTQRAFVHSEKGEDTYITTYRYCTCWDFRTRELPCKHMYAVMLNLGILPPE